MIEHVYQHISGAQQPSPMTLDQMFAWNIRFQVLTDTDEERDYLYALQLMYGREIQIETWAEWNEKRQALFDTRRMKLKLLPIVFTTFEFNLGDL